MKKAACGRSAAKLLPALLAGLVLLSCDTPSGPGRPAELGYLWARALADAAARDWDPEAPCSGVLGTVGPDGLLTGAGLFDSFWRFYYQGEESFLRVTVDPQGAVLSEEVAGTFGARTPVPDSLDSPAIMEGVRAHIEEENPLRPPEVLHRADFRLLASAELEPRWEVAAGYDYPTPICGDWSGACLEADAKFKLTGLAYVEEFRLTVDVAGEEESFVIEKMVLRDRDNDGYLDWFGATAYFWDETLKLRVDGYLDPFTGHVDGTWSWEAIPFEDSGVWEADWERFDYWPVIEVNVDPTTGEVE